MGDHDINIVCVSEVKRKKKNSPELIYLGVPANPYCGDSTSPSYRLGLERDIAKKKRKENVYESSTQSGC